MIKNIEKSNENVAINDKEIAILREHFPACFKTDGSFDIERFKETLKDKVDVVNEGYELKFLGKSYAKLLASLIAKEKPATPVVAKKAPVAKAPAKPRSRAPKAKK